MGLRKLGAKKHLGLRNHKAKGRDPPPPVLNHSSLARGASTSWPAKGSLACASVKKASPGHGKIGGPGVFVGSLGDSVGHFVGSLGDFVGHVEGSLGDFEGSLGDSWRSPKLNRHAVVSVAIARSRVSDFERCFSLGKHRLARRMNHRITHSFWLFLAGTKLQRAIQRKSDLCLMQGNSGLHDLLECLVAKPRTKATPSMATATAAAL